MNTDIDRRKLYYLDGKIYQEARFHLISMFFRLSFLSSCIYIYLCIKARLKFIKVLGPVCVASPIQSESLFEASEVRKWWGSLRGGRDGGSFDVQRWTTLKARWQNHRFWPQHEHCPVPLRGATTWMNMKQVAAESLDPTVIWDLGSTVFEDQPVFF